MGQLREVDAISDAIMETEKEIAGEAWGNEETSALDETGGRALESMGQGLEGQHEVEDGDASSEEQEDGDSEETEEAEEGEDGEEGDEAGTETAGDGKTAQQQREQEPPAGRVPSGKLREEAEKRRLAEARVTELEAKLAGTTGDNPKIAALEAQLQQLTSILNGQRQSPQAVKEEPKAEPEVPDIFENPKGFVEHILGAVQQAVAPVRQDVRKNAVETSFALAHATHKDTFGKAFEAINGLNPQNPDDRATVQRIYNSANPGEELVRWHKRSQALARFGEDPDAAEARIREDTRQALLKDPEFRKQLIADLRGEAAAGENGPARTTTRLPQSLARAGGSNLGVERGDHVVNDNSDQSVADAAWR
ncbi:hypothetical protein [Bradyrhizobium betae]|uniref:Uncharacterized protein n=1 Tax=Bradyrhizobium betae TaxID=244734 RepID=A0A5P6NYV6_9BRAD|nr:hypothetical protein [Bradyrhizobium betae]MCS3725500.1 hypothetical protein [Bradyrhizobium betae]QFI71212.1 hypothetical protein F8237_01780 [Bradyrhizobium betae]